jgi:hypothetical protein
MYRTLQNLKDSEKMQNFFPIWFNILRRYGNLPEDMTEAWLQHILQRQHEHRPFTELPTSLHCQLKYTEWPFRLTQGAAIL